METETAESRHHGSASLERRPGLLQVWSPEGPLCRPIPVAGELILGRVGTFPLQDTWTSRQHCRIALSGRTWEVEDLASRNGTFVGCEQIRGPRRFDEPPPIRVGHSVFLAVPHLDAYGEGVSVEGDVIVGPRLRELRRTIAQVAHEGDNLLIVGPTGAGKELAARHYHASSRQHRGPFVAVNCAAVPEGLAERLLFGTTRGAYSGANEAAQGYFQAADGGTLLLDELGELDLAVQAKLLRVLETREVVPLGSTRPTRVDVRVCFATHRDLDGLVRQKKFRQDLYFRIASPTVRLAPLHERLVEIPFILRHTLDRLDPPRMAHASLVEYCLTRGWPGNVRELVAAVRAAARVAARAGRELVESSDLAPPPDVADLERPEVETPREQVRPARAPIVSADKLADRGVVEAALHAEQGSVRGAARRLGVHRNQLRRWLDRAGIDPRAFGDGDD